MLRDCKNCGMSPSYNTNSSGYTEVSCWNCGTRETGYTYDEAEKNWNDAHGYPITFTNSGNTAPVGVSGGNGVGCTFNGSGSCAGCNGCDAIKDTQFESTDSRGEIKTCANCGRGCFLLTTVYCEPKKESMKVSEVCNSWIYKYKK